MAGTVDLTGFMRECATARTMRTFRRFSRGPSMDAQPATARLAAAGHRRDHGPAPGIPLFPAAPGPVATNMVIRTGVLAGRSTYNPSSPADSPGFHPAFHTDLSTTSTMVARQLIRAAGDPSLSLRNMSSRCSAGTGAISAKFDSSSGCNKALKAPAAPPAFEHDTTLEPAATGSVDNPGSGRQYREAPGVRQRQSKPDAGTRGRQDAWRHTEMGLGPRAQAQDRSRIQESGVTLQRTTANSR